MRTDETGTPPEPIVAPAGCAVHPGVPALYRCDGCGRQLCAECTRPSTRLTLCAHCGELALPLALPPERQAAMFLGLPAALGMQLRAVPDLAPSDEEVDALVRFYVGALTAAAPLEEKR